MDSSFVHGMATYILLVRTYGLQYNQLVMIVLNQRFLS